MTLEDFPTARLDEDEAAAKAAARTSGQWHVDIEGNVQDRDTGGGGTAYVGVGPWGGPMDRSQAAHIARNDPARALREVAAKRKLLALHAVSLHELNNPFAGASQREYEARCPICECEWPCPEVRTIAAVWSDHPDYQAWAKGL